MKKNRFFWIIAAVAIAALAMTGCPPDDGGGGGGGGGGDETTTLTGIEFEPTSMTIGVDQTMTSPLVPLPVPRTATLGTIEWSSEDDEYVTVSNGYITGVKITEEDSPVKVYAKSGTITGYCEVTVTEHGTPATSISVTPATYSLEVGHTHQLVANQLPFGAADPIEWTSEDDDKVTVDEDGLITAVAVTGSTPVKITATSKTTDTISGFSSITVTAAPIVSDIELKLAFIPGPSNADTPPTLPAKNADNVYVIDELFTDGNFSSSQDGFRDMVLVYPDIVLNGDFKFRARVQITDTGSSTSASKGLAIGAFKGADEVGNFSTGIGAMQTTSINLRLNGEMRVLQCRPDNPLSAQTFPAYPPDKTEEFIYEVIRTDTDITTTMYISKTGDPLYVGSTQLTRVVTYTNGPYIQGDTPVYAGIALFAVKANISQIELWDGDLEGNPVFYSGNSTAAPVRATGIRVTVEGEKGTLTATGSMGTAANPAQYIVKEGDAEGSLQLVAAITPAYADVPGAKFYASTVEGHPNDNTITVNESGLVTISAPGSKTIQAISNDEDYGGSYYLTIIVTPDYVPVTDFEITSDHESISVGSRTTLRSNIPATVTDPEVVWTNDNNAAVKFVHEGVESDTFTGHNVTVIGKAVAASVTITATATTTDKEGVETVVVKTKTIAVTQSESVIWEWNKGDSFVNSGTAARVNDIYFARGGGQLALATASDGDGTLTGALAMTGGARWVLGLPLGLTDSPAWVNGTASGETVYATDAELDLSMKYRLTVKYYYPTPTEAPASTQFAVALNTHTGGNNHGPVVGDGTDKARVFKINGVEQTLGNWSSSTILDVAPYALTIGEVSQRDKEVTLEVTVDPQYTAIRANAQATVNMNDVVYNQWIQFRASSTTTPFYITYIKLEKVVDEEEDEDD
jgi:hypothetical protein